MASNTGHTGAFRIPVTASAGGPICRMNSSTASPAAPGRERVVELARVLDPLPRVSAFRGERRLVQGQFGDRRAARRRGERERGTGGDAVDACGTARLADQSGDVVDLAVDRERGGVPLLPRPRRS